MLNFRWLNSYQNWMYRIKADHKSWQMKSGYGDSGIELFCCDQACDYYV